MTRREPAPGFERTLYALAALALVVRCAYLLAEPRCGLQGDEPSWMELARQLRRPGGHFAPLDTRFLYFAPVYPYFVGSLWWLFGTVAAAQWAQCLLGSTLVLAVGRVAARSFGPPAGALAALSVALWPEFVWFSVHFWSESVFVTLLWWAIERTLAADGARSRRAAVVAGMFWGLTALTREIALYLVPFVILWLLRPAARPGEPVHRPRTGGLALATALGLTAALTVLPWTLRNAIVFRAFIPVSTNGNLNLWVGNTHLRHTDIYEILETKGDEVAQDRYCRAMAWKEISARQPWWIFEKIRDQMPQFWIPGSEVVDHYVGREACGPLAPRQQALLETVLVLPYLAVLSGFVVGLARLRLDGGAWLLLLLLGAYNAAHVVAYGEPRYRLPVMPIPIVFAAAVVAGLRSGDLLPLRGWRKALLVALVVATLAVLAPGAGSLTLWTLLPGAFR